MQIVEGNLLEAKEKYICHQCNCVTDRAKGLAQALFGKFPYANVYKQRSKESVPETIHVAGNGRDKRFIINMFAQYSPGKVKERETAEMRLKYFRECLAKIAEIPDLESLAFPFLIGCGLAGGDWNLYLEELEAFAKTVKVPVILYRYN